MTQKVKVSFFFLMRKKEKGEVKVDLSFLN